MPGLRLQDRLLRLVNGPGLVDHWIEQVLDRHASIFSTAQYVRAIRALSARYVEQRHVLPHRSAIDSAGKRAAFAGFYAPLHFLTATRILGALQARAGAPAPCHQIVDLGCGTGVIGAAVGHEHPGARLTGVDADTWALGEAQWNWQTLDLRGRTARADLVSWVAGKSGRSHAEARRASRTAPSIGARPGATVWSLGWCVNELPENSRRRLLDALVGRCAEGDGVAIIEPIAHAITPWWGDWCRALSSASTFVDEWAFEADLPERLARLDESAGFSRGRLKAKSLMVRPPAAAGPPLAPESDLPLET